MHANPCLANFTFVFSNAPSLHFREQSDRMFSHVPSLHFREQSDGMFSDVQTLHFRKQSDGMISNVPTLHFPLWELECCKILWLRRECKLWNHSLQIISGSWNAVKHNGLEGNVNFGITLCRSSLGAGML